MIQIFDTFRFIKSLSSLYFSFFVPFSALLPTRFFSYVTAAICTSTWLCGQRDQKPLLICSWNILFHLYHRTICHFLILVIIGVYNFLQKYSWTLSPSVTSRTSTKLSWTKRRCTSATSTNFTTCTWKHKTTQVQIFPHTLHPAAA